MRTAPRLARRGGRATRARQPRRGLAQGLGRKEALPGFDAKEAARLLKRRELLLTDGEPGRLTKKKKHDGQATNFYWVSGKIVEEAEA